MEMGNNISVSTLVSKYSAAIIQPEKDGIFASGGVSVDGRFVSESLLSPAALRVQRPISVSTKTKYESLDVLYLGCFYNCWGHSITDSLRFLWIFLPQYENLLSSLGISKMVYITAGGAKGKELGDNFIKILSILGVDKYIIGVSEPTQFKTVYIPEPCFYEDELTVERHFTNRYQEIIDYIIQQVNAGCSIPITKTVYFSRSKWQKGIKRKDFGEKTIERAVRRKYRDCEIVYPEQLTFEEQVRLLTSCRRFISTEGSISHNAVFLPYESECVILQKCWLKNRYQKAINESRRLKEIYINAYWKNHLINEKNNPMVGPFFLCVTKELGDYLGCKPSFSIRERIIYEQLYLYRRLKIFIKKILKMQSLTK